jgi:ATP-binding protein involved in chromosome partitioning
VRKFRTYHEVDHSTGSELMEQVVEQRSLLADRLDRIGQVVAVASGKGGVGKSVVSANLAVGLAAAGLRVGALDADLNGPSLARMLGVTGAQLVDGQSGIEPPSGAEGVRVMSMELLQAAEDAPLRWRDPGADTFLWQSSMETTALREFLADVAWDGSDVLIVDVPPGTDKIRRLLELVPGLGTMLLVTTPSEMSRAVVRRSIRLVEEAGIPRVGLVANMTEYHCPDCSARHPLFGGEGADELARESGLEIWARIPFDPRLGHSTDRGRPLVLDEPEGAVGQAFSALIARLQEAA